LNSKKEKKTKIENAMQVKKEKKIFLKIRHLHARIAKSMPHAQPKQNVQSAKQKNKIKMQSLNFPKSLH
jgi:hypothetical protein